MYTEEYLNELQELSLDDFKTHFLKDKVFEIKVESDTKLVVSHENDKIKKVFYRQNSTLVVRLNTLQYTYLISCFV